MSDIEPPWTPSARVDSTLQGRGFAVVPSPDVRHVLRADEASLGSVAAYWTDLPVDTHLLDGGLYRRRRHGCFVVDGGAVQAHPHRAHWQPVEYNALHGGIERWFQPLPPGLLATPEWSRMLAWLGERADALRGARPWYVEAHAFRIETTGGIGRPTPEGAHRDGVDLVAVLVVARHAVRGGETRVFDADGPSGSRFTLREAWTLLMLDDARVVHETTPILPLVNATGSDAMGHRDTLVVTFRAGGFQAPADR